MKGGVEERRDVCCPVDQRGINVASMKGGAQERRDPTVQAIGMGGQMPR
jgi:hypothetical protein